MRNVIGAFVGLVLLAGCMDAAGINGVNDYAEEWLASGKPALVRCSANGAPVLDQATITVGVNPQCSAYNAAGTHLSAEGFPAVIWTVSDTAVASVNLTGLVTTKAPGSVFVRASGPQGSAASLFLTVQ